MKERYSPDTCPYCGAWREEKQGILSKDGFVCFECLESELDIAYKTVREDDKMLEKYTICVSMGSMYYEKEFFGNIEEAKKETDHIASLVFHEDGDTVSLYKDGRFIYFGTLLQPSPANYNMV